MAHGLYQPKPMPWPLPPGRYTILQGIPAYIRIIQEGKEDINDPEVVCIALNIDENRIHTTTSQHSQMRGAEKEAVSRFAELPAELRTAVLDRFRELFALEIGQGNNGPRGLRTKHYTLNPLTITVPPRETHDNATQDAQQSQAVPAG